MELIISLRAFCVDDPTQSETWGLIGEADGDRWDYAHDPTPDQFGESFSRFRDEELADIDADQPALQCVYGDVVVVLDEICFRVIDDGIECEYRLSNGNELGDGQTICSSRNDADVGGTAERQHGDNRIADAVQRTSDALDHRIDWITVISPRSLSPVVDAAEDVVGEDDAMDEEERHD